jgi:hypothetical protein
MTTAAINSASRTTKFAFRIRSRTGMVVENLAIHGRDESDAQRKLVQMYPHCQVLECRSVGAPRETRPEHASFEHVLSLVTK